jgi:hypothetical protein
MLTLRRPEANVEQRQIAKALNVGGPLVNNKNDRELWFDCLDLAMKFRFSLLCCGARGRFALGTRRGSRDAS